MFYLESYVNKPLLNIKRRKILPVWFIEYTYKLIIIIITTTSIIIETPVHSSVLLFVILVLISKGDVNTDDY